MRRLIKMQIRNIFTNKLFYVCLGLFLLISPIATFLTDMLMHKEGTQVFPSIISFLSGEVGVICQIFIALFCCYDFSHETTKNIIAKGYTRVQLLFSKYIGSFIGVFSIYIINILVALILFTKNGIGFDSNMILSFVNIIFMIIASVIFFATMSFLLEKSGGAIVACIVVPTAINLLLIFLEANFKLNISQYWLGNLSSKFINNPTLNNLYFPICGYLIYTAIFIVIGIQLTKRKEIK